MSLCADVQFMRQQCSGLFGLFRCAVGEDRIGARGTFDCSGSSGKLVSGKERLGMEIGESTEWWCPGQIEIMKHGNAGAEGVQHACAACRAERQGM